MLFLLQWTSFSKKTSQEVVLKYILKISLGQNMFLVATIQ